MRIEAADGNVLDSYLHIQGGRGVNAVLVELAGGIAGARPRHRRAHRLRPSEVPHAATMSRPTWSSRAGDAARPSRRNEGKPEAALAKIVDGRLNGFFKDVALLDQPYAKDDKQSVSQLLGGATIVRFAQVEIG